MASERRKPQKGKQLLLRFPEGSDLRDRLEEIARANGRSTTAEVILRLEASLQAGQEFGGSSFARTVKAAAARTRSLDANIEDRLQRLEKAFEALQKANVSEKVDPSDLKGTPYSL